MIWPALTKIMTHATNCQANTFYPDVVYKDPIGNMELTKITRRNNTTKRPEKKYMFESKYYTRFTRFLVF